MKNLSYNAIVSYLTSDKFTDLLAYNSFANQYCWLAAPPINIMNFHSNKEVNFDDDTSEIRLLLENMTGMNASLSDICQAIRHIGKKKAFNPLTDYLSALQWDKTPRISNWLTTYLSAPDTELNRAIARAWLISAVVRAFKPGEKVDNALILEGLQGKKKSTALEKLGAGFFTDQLSDIDNKDTFMQLQGKWIVEFAELDSIAKKDVTAVKSFITRKTDRFRPPYMRHVYDFPRTCVFAGSTNDAEYLKDPTGSRRFYCVETGEIHLDSLEADRDQLWAEAVEAFKSGEHHWLTDDLAKQLAESNASRTEQDPFYDALLEDPILLAKKELTNAELFASLKVVHPTQPQEKRLTNVMKALGFEKKQRRIDKRVRRIWVSTDTLGTVERAFDLEEFLAEAAA